ncbi:ElyC/SanA/YdcF family protein [Anderseniella sp. Alg231-50]|uniref:ElyC/SanA/YdcF family protein n=1 Tax=Anderseniella sp. Alg231-50 TaxID=1922226 RepID=UPI000D5623EB
MSDPSGKSSAETHDSDTQRRRGNSWWVGLGIVVCMLLAATAGFASFSEKSRKIAGPANLSVDGIVVLTGGPERISAAVRLLEQKTARRLLISGVYPATTARQLSRITQAEASLFNCCVDLDKRAPDTRGNAAEAADWATRHKFRKIAVVTSDYHILRAIVEFSRAMPDVELVPYPVASDDTGKTARSFSMLRLWISEYVKYLLALLL